MKSAFDNLSLHFGPLDFKKQQHSRMQTWLEGSDKNRFYGRHPRFALFVWFFCRCTTPLGWPWIAKDFSPPGGGALFRLVGGVVGTGNKTKSHQSGEQSGFQLHGAKLNYIKGRFLQFPDICRHSKNYICKNQIYEEHPQSFILIYNTPLVNFYFFWMKF